MSDACTAHLVHLPHQRFFLVPRSSARRLAPCSKTTAYYRKHGLCPVLHIGAHLCSSRARACKALDFDWMHPLLPRLLLLLPLLLRLISAPPISLSVSST
jgi:hypothetical protein